MSVKKILNASAHADNTLVLHTSESNCCGSAQTFCLYTIATDVTGGAITGITFTVDGVATAVVFPVGPDYTVPKNVRLAINDAIRAQGFDPHFDDNFRGVVVNADEVRIIGELPVASIQNGGNDAAVAACTAVGVCKLTGSLTINSDFVLDYNGSSATINAASASATATAIDAWATGASVDFHKGAVVNADGTFELHVENPDVAIAITGDGDQLTQGGCYPSFKA